MIEMGESAGHPFRGNQWTEGETGPSNDPPVGDRPQLVEGVHYRYDENKKMELLPAYEKFKGTEQAWKDQMTRAVIMGTISQADAEKTGWYGDNSGKFEPLPPTLYHVTTSLSGVAENGLLTRDQLGQDKGSGLGGGVSNLVSFTSDPEIAAGIEKAVLEARQVATGEITASDILDRARTGEDAKEPYIENLMRGWNSDWKVGDPIPQGVQDIVNGEKSASWARGILFVDPEDKVREGLNENHPGDWQPDRSTKVDSLKIDAYSRWYRTATPDETRNDTFELFKRASMWRQFHGGPMDPLFFSSDTKSLAATPAHEIGIVTATPKPGATGTQVSALGEWRTLGDAVDIKRPTTAAVELGESAGHPFRGNQYSDGASGGDSFPTTNEELSRMVQDPRDWMRTRDGKPITADTKLLVFHATRKEHLDTFLTKGVNPDDKPRTLARERYQSGEKAEYSPGNGVGNGLYVSADPNAASGYGYEMVAVSVRAGDLSVPPESTVPPGETPLATALRALRDGNGATIETRIRPEQIRQYGLASKADRLIPKVDINELGRPTTASIDGEWTPTWEREGPLPGDSALLSAL